MNNNALILAKTKQLSVTEQAKHLVAIDLGSNSFHLIIAREQDGCLQILHRQKQSIAIAAGLNSAGFLSDKIIEKAVDCLHEFNLAIDGLPCCISRIVATYALRTAKNIEQFKEKAQQVLPYPIEVISGKLEAELIYKGVAHTQPLHGTTFIIDIGGGSTELVVGHKFSIFLADSMSMGCISFQQQFFLNGEITATAMNNAQLYAAEQLTGVADRYRVANCKVTLGTSGSIKVIAQVMLELYGDKKITVKRLNRLVKQLIQWQHCDNIPLHSLEENRRPLLAGAVAILSSCFNLLGIKQMHFSLGGLREGVLYDLSQSRTDIDTRERTIQNLSHLYHVDQAFNQGVLQQITFMNQQLPQKKLLTQDELSFLTWAAQLHEIGISINSKKRQRHSAYIIKHSDMPGFSENEQLIIAQLVRNHRGKIKFKHTNNVAQNKQTSIKTVRIPLLTQLLRLAIIFTHGRVQSQVTPITVNHIVHTDNGERIEVNLNSQTHLLDTLIAEVEVQASIGLVLVIK